METSHHVDDTTIADEQRSTVQRTWESTLAKVKAHVQQDDSPKTRSQAMWSAKYHVRQLVSAVAYANQDIVSTPEDDIDLEFDRIMARLRDAEMEVQQTLAMVEAWRMRHLLLEAKQ